MNSFLKGLGYFGTALIFVLAAVFFSELISGEKPLPPGNELPIARPAVSCPPDFLSYQKLIENPSRTIKLINQRKSMFAENGGFVNLQIVITKNETQESRVACGYLFVIAGTTTNGALQNWENIYINPNQFGGHINPEDHIGRGDSNNYSEYLFPLNKIKYWKNRAERSKGNLSIADWAALLNVSERVEFNIALNTNNKTGFIEEVSIAYKCWNPKTGEENNECSLNIEGKSDTIKILP